jgi:hypothetical protein
VSASPQTDANGVFTDSAWSTGYTSRPGGGAITVTGERSWSPDRFWNKPGTYYWHAYVADCPFVGPRPHTCTQRVITPTRSFTIASHALVLTVAGAPSRTRLGDPLAVRIGCSNRCRVTVTVLARGKRLFDAATGHVVAADTKKRFSFMPGKWRKTLKRSLGARRSLRLTIRVTAHDRYGQRDTQSSGATLVPPSCAA